MKEADELPDTASSRGEEDEKKQRDDISSDAGTLLHPAVLLDDEKSSGLPKGISRNAADRHARYRERQEARKANSSEGGPNTLAATVADVDDSTTTPASTSSGSAEASKLERYRRHTERQEAKKKANDDNKGTPAATSLTSSLPTKNQNKLRLAPGVAMTDDLLPSTSNNNRNKLRLAPGVATTTTDDSPVSVRVGASEVTDGVYDDGDHLHDNAEEGVLIQAHLVDDENEARDDTAEDEEAPRESASQEVYKAKAVSGQKTIYVVLGVVVAIAVILAVVFLTRDNNNNGDNTLSPAKNEEEIPTTPPLGEKLQVGNTIIGPAPFNRFGSPMAISSNGQIVAVGAKNGGAMGEDSGMVRVYELRRSLNNNETFIWIQIGNPLTGREPGDEFAHSGLAMNANGTRIAVGATFYDAPLLDDDVNGTLMTELNLTEPIMVDAGHVRVFDYDGSLWRQVGDEIVGLLPGDLFGRAVAMSPDGSIIAASAYESSKNGPQSGHVRVFKETPIDGRPTWKQMGRTLAGKGPKDYIGRAVDLSEDGLRLVAGATELKGEGPGYVQVFEWNGNDWVQLGQDVYGEKDQDLFGRDVALSGDGTIFAAGANLADNPEMSAGKAQVYQLKENEDGSHVWKQIGQTFLGELENDGLGLTVALSADGLRFVVGASQKNGGTGYVRIFDFDSDNDQWIQLGTDLRGENDLDKFGTEVALSRDANTLAVGTIASDANGEDASVQPEGTTLIGTN